MILVCGEALVDLFVNEDQSSDLTAQVVLGGSPFNVAIGLARQCQDTLDVTVPVLPL